MNETTESIKDLRTRKTDKISNINILALTEDEYVVYPRSRLVFDPYLCVYEEDQVHVGIFMWNCYRQDSTDKLCSRQDLGQLFKWISQHVQTQEEERL